MVQAWVKKKSRNDGDDTKARCVNEVRSSQNREESPDKGYSDEEEGDCRLYWTGSMIGNFQETVA